MMVNPRQTVNVLPMIESGNFARLTTSTNTATCTAATMMKALIGLTTASKSKSSQVASVF